MVININHDRRSLIAVGGQLVAQCLNVSIIFMIPWISQNEQETIFTLNYFFGTVVYAIASGYLSIFNHSLREIITTSLINLLAITLVIQFVINLSTTHSMVIFITCSSMTIVELISSRAVYAKRLYIEIAFKLSIPLLKFGSLYIFFRKFPSLSIDTFYLYVMLPAGAITLLLFIKNYSIKILTFQLNYVIYLFYSLLPIFYTSSNGDFSRMAFYMTVINFILLPFSLYMHRTTIPDLIAYNNKKNNLKKWHFLIAVLPITMLHQSFTDYFGFSEPFTVILIITIILIRIFNTYYALLIQTPQKKMKRLICICCGIAAFVSVATSFSILGLTLEDNIYLIAFVISEVVMGFMYRKVSNG